MRWSLLRVLLEQNVGIDGWMLEHWLMPWMDGHGLVWSDGLVWSGIGGIGGFCDLGGLGSGDLVVVVDVFLTPFSSSSVLQLPILSAADQISLSFSFSFFFFFFFIVVVVVIFHFLRLVLLASVIVPVTSGIKSSSSDRTRALAHFSRPISPALCMSSVGTVVGGSLLPS